MLKSLSITNIAVAKLLDIEFSDGFSVITGETGAGKSIIIDCLGLLCGEKASRELVRTGETKAVVSGIFDMLTPQICEKLTGLGTPPDENGELEITRTISVDGKSTVRVNRRPCPLSALREIGACLLHIQTQNERLLFADTGAYISLLDGYAHSEALLHEYKDSYHVLAAKRQEIENLQKSLADRNRLLDVYKYQLEEIDRARLGAEDEEERLLQKRARVRDAEQVRKNASIVRRALRQSEKGIPAAEQLERAENALYQLAEAVEGAEEMARQLENYRYEIIDIAERVESVLDDDMLENPEKQLTAIEGRLYTIDRLKKKYGATIAEIKAFRAKTAAQIDEMESGDLRLSELQKEEKAMEAACSAQADALHAHRVQAAARLTETILEDLRFLEMPKVRFSVQVQKRSRREGLFRENGWDDVDFLLSVNPGEALQSMGKIASGGELSRVMLAMKASIVEENAPGTVVFDEIDTGVSGSTAQRIGILLRKLSAHSQVLAVTHSPQIAALAENHYRIFKSMEGERAESHVSHLAKEERIDEIARIIGGIQVTETQRKAAREMLRSSVQVEEPESAAVTEDTDANKIIQKTTIS